MLVVISIVVPIVVVVVVSCVDHLNSQENDSRGKGLVEENS
jgi:hypothetical protein